jgi:hypothetical protein
MPRGAKRWCFSARCCYAGLFSPIRFIPWLWPVWRGRTVTRVPRKRWRWLGLLIARLIQRADQALYQAKLHGRNAVVVFEHHLETCTDGAK